MAAVVTYLKSTLQGGRPVLLASGIPGKANGFHAAVTGSRRGVHSGSVYDKNLDDGIRPAAPVPDDVIGGPHKHYWAPNPATGVFGPASAPDQHQQLSAAHHPGSNHAGSASSVLDQHAWFRTVDGVDY